MTGALSHCPHCGLFFLANSFSMVGSRNITFEDCITDCPKCRKAANVVDGTFDFVDNAINVINAPPKTIALLTALQNALRAAQQGKPTNEAISEIEKEAPELAHAITSKISRNGGAALGALLLSLLAGCSMNTTLNLNQLIDQVHVYSTGAEPYPNIQKQEESGSESGTEPKMSRQQRRYKERQAKKKLRQNEREKRTQH